MTPGRPVLAQPIDLNGGRHSFIEQLGNVYKEINHHGEPDKTAAKIAKYFVRALDAAKIAGVDFAEVMRPLVEATVELTKLKDKPAELKAYLEGLSGNGTVEGGSERYEHAVTAVLSRLTKRIVGDMDRGVAGPTETLTTPGSVLKLTDLKPKLWEQAAARESGYRHAGHRSLAKGQGGMVAGPRADAGRRRGRPATRDRLHAQRRWKDVDGKSGCDPRHLDFRQAGCTESLRRSSEPISRRQANTQGPSVDSPMCARMACGG